LIDVIDSRTDKVVATVKVGDDPVGVVADPGTHKVYVGIPNDSPPPPMEIP